MKILNFEDLDGLSGGGWNGDCKGIPKLSGWSAFAIGLGATVAIFAAPAAIIAGGITLAIGGSLTLFANETCV